MQGAEKRMEDEIERMMSLIVAFTDGLGKAMKNAIILRRDSHNPIKESGISTSVDRMLFIVAIKQYSNQRNS
jgi:hypothetical protein